MRRLDETQEPPFTTVKPEHCVPCDHPLWPIQVLNNKPLKRSNGLFSTISADDGRVPIAPHKRLSELLQRVLYAVRSERKLMEQMRLNLLVSRFVNLAIEDPVRHHAAFSMNRDRLLEREVIETFFKEVVGMADKRGLLSHGHFWLDGPLKQVWTSQKSFRPRGGSHDSLSGGGRNAEAERKCRRCSNESHESSTDPGAAVPQGQVRRNHSVLPGAHPDGEPLGLRGGSGRESHRRLCRACECLAAA